MDINRREILTQARAMIADPERWTQDTEARDAADNSVSQDDPSASKFCAGAAIDIVISRLYPQLAGDNDVWKLAVAPIEILVNDNVTSFNDSHSHAEVLDAFDSALKCL